MATNIFLITNVQRDILINSENGYIKFEPIQDLNNNYLISEQEYYYCLGLWYLDELNIDLQFITTLSLSEYLPKPQTPLI